MTNITIEDVVEDLVTSYYEKKCGLTKEEVRAMVRNSTYDKELNYEIEQAVYRYIDELLWDIGKPTIDFQEEVKIIKNGYQTWLRLNNKLPSYNHASEYLDTLKLNKRDRFLIHSILRGREMGDLRETRLG